jgi:F-type H+-transporting ATPase subunit a
MHESIHIALAPGELFSLWGIPITNTLITTWVVVLLLICIGYFVGRSLKMIPSKLQLIFETVIAFTLQYMEEVLENKRLARVYLPLILTLFFFILLANLLGLVPGIGSVGFYIGEEGHSEFVSLLYPANTDLNVTLALAIIAFFAIEIAGVTAIGLFKYAHKFINFRSPIDFFVGLIELISELARLVTFSFRLFGNIFAGKVLILIATFFVPLLVPVPLMVYEVFVAFIQATVFALLTLFFIKIAVAEPH